MAEREYTAVVYHSTTGQVLYDLDLASEPEWSSLINDPGGWKITVPLDPGPRTLKVREWCLPWRFSVAIMRGDFVCQAGPIVAYAPDPANTVHTVSGKGIWEFLNHRVLVNAAWNPASTRITNTSADITLTNSLPNLARELVNHSINKTFILGSNLPVDLPALGPTGSSVRSWFGYEMAMAGARLQELTQVADGPDVLFQPYMIRTGSVRFIRHRMLIGDPYITQPGVPLLFDYRSTLTSLTIAGDGSSEASTAYVKGTGNETGQLYGYSSDQSLLAAGWPMLDMVDSGHTSTSEQTTLDGWATADIDIYNAQPEQWQATVLADREPVMGSYSPGHFVNYSVSDHHWLPNGIYEWRLLGLSKSSGTPRDRVDQQVQAVRF